MVRTPANQPLDAQRLFASPADGEAGRPSAGVVLAGITGASTEAPDRARRRRNNP